MFEAKLAEGYVFKRIVEAIKDLVTDVNLDVSPSGKYTRIFWTTKGMHPGTIGCHCNSKLLIRPPFFLFSRFSAHLSNASTITLGISLQAMDTSHVALVSLNLSMEGFEEYRCDQNVVLGINIANMSKVMKLADPSDSITLQADQDPSTLKITFENQKTGRTTEFALNLITLDVEHLSIPDTEYTSIITINSGEFTKICKELQQLSDGLTISTNKDEVQLSVEGAAGHGFIKLTSNESDRKEEQTVIEVEQPVT